MSPTPEREKQETKSGWLATQLRLAADRVNSWPEWKKDSVLTALERTKKSTADTSTPGLTIAGWFDGHEFIELPEEAAKRPNVKPLYLLSLPSTPTQEGAVHRRRRRRNV